MKIFDNSGIFGNATTIPAESVSVENVENVEIAGIVEDLPELPGMSKNFHILANTPNHAIYQTCPDFITCKHDLFPLGLHVESPVFTWSLKACNVKAKRLGKFQIIKIAHEIAVKVQRFTTL